MNDSDIQIKDISLKVVDNKLRIAIVSSPHNGAFQYLDANDIKAFREALERFEKHIVSCESS